MSRIQKWAHLPQVILQTGTWYAHDWVRDCIKQMVHDIINSRRDLVPSKHVVVMVGLSKSGKTTFVAESEYAAYLQIQSDALHNLLNQNFPFLRDDNTVHGKAYKLRQVFTWLVRRELYAKATLQHIPVVVDSCNLSHKTRQDVLKPFRKVGYRVTLVWMRTPNEMILNRCAATDAALRAVGGLPTWVELNRQQLDQFEAPRKREADELIVTLPDWKQYSEFKAS